MNEQKERKTVVVTGATSGIGLGIAEAYARQGANVVLNARSEDKLHEVAKGIGPAERVAVVAGDIAHKETGDRMVNVAVERFGRVDLLINNAGHFYAKAFTEYSEDDIDRFLAVNLKGGFLSSQAAVKQMRKQGGGAIVNITTILALRGVSAIPATGPVAAKGGLNALTRSLAIELAPDNIRVNAVAPGIIKTPLYDRTDEQFDELNGLQPLGHVGVVKDIVDAVLYLADATFVTGVVLPVDGGAHAGGA